MLLSNACNIPLCSLRSAFGSQTPVRIAPHFVSTPPERIDMEHAPLYDRGKDRDKDSSLIRESDMPLKATLHLCEAALPNAPRLSSLLTYLWSNVFYTWG
ncbi:jg2003 [Pararge aegeria aegeria]|uniref:Jg2003 protein n=1 Tax=Pararge aegeria aegeria TaxID=348720 RepID=A0A8S4S9B5_9NEOP|nr:jg2003 [Pararge aegeria aegeria]